MTEQVWLVFLGVAVGCGCMNGFFAWFDMGIDGNRVCKTTLAQWAALVVAAIILSVILRGNGIVRTGELDGI